MGLYAGGNIEYINGCGESDKNDLWYNTVHKIFSLWGWVTERQ